MYGEPGKREQSALWDVLSGSDKHDSAVATVPSKTIYCLPHGGGEVGGSKKQRSRWCSAGQVGCGSDFFFCHIPHYPHNTSVRQAASRVEREAVESAARNMRCTPGAAACSAAAVSVLAVSPGELTEVAGFLQTNRWWGALNKPTRTSAWHEEDARHGRPHVEVAPAPPTNWTSYRQELLPTGQLVSVLI